MYLNIEIYYDDASSGHGNPGWAYRLKADDSQHESITASGALPLKRPDAQLTSLRRALQRELRATLPVRPWYLIGGSRGRGWCFADRVDTRIADGILVATIDENPALRTGASR